MLLIGVMGQTRGVYRVPRNDDIFLFRICYLKALALFGFMPSWENPQSCHHKPSPFAFFRRRVSDSLLGYTSVSRLSRMSLLGYMSVA